MKLKTIHTLVFFCISILSFSQNKQPGFPYHNFYPVETYGFPEQTWWISEDQRGFIYVATNSGLMEFDGCKPEFYKIDNNTTVRSILPDNKGRIYAGAAHTFGYFKPDHKGKLEYHSLVHLLDKEDLDFNDVWQIRSCHPYIYFHTFKKIFRYHPEEHTIVTIHSQTEFGLTGVFNNELYVGLKNVGLCKISGNRTVLVNGGEFLSEKVIYSILPFDSANILISDKNTLYIYNVRDNFYQKKLSEKLMKNLSFTDQRIYSIFSVDFDKFGIVTLNNGLYIIDKDGHILNHYSSENILPSNYLSFGCQTKDGNIWLALDGGIFKIEHALPVLRMNIPGRNYQKVFSIINNRNKLFFATNQGLYRCNINSPKSEGCIEIFEEANFGCNDLTVYLESNKNRKDTLILCASDEGLFLIKNGNLKWLTDKIVCYTAIQSKSNPETIFFATNRGLAYINSTQQQLHVIKFVPHIKGTVGKIIEDNSGNLWISTKSHGFYFLWYKGDEFKVLFHDESAKSQPNPDFAMLWQEKIIYVANDSIFSFHTKKLVTENLNRNFPEMIRTKSFYLLKPYNDNIFWISAYAKNISYPIQLNHNTIPEYNSLFRRLSENGIFSIFQQNDSTVWFGTKNGIFYVQNFSSFRPHKNRPGIFLRKIVLGNDSLIYAGNGPAGLYSIAINDENATISNYIEYGRNNLTVSVCSPGFFNEKNTLYRFYLKGYEKSWGEWDFANTRKFSNLKKGKYTLMVQAMNVFGIESRVLFLNFEISPPWFRTIYFHLMIFVVIGSLLTGMIYFFRKKYKKEKIKLEKIIHQRTSEIIHQKEKIESQAAQLNITNQQLSQLSIVARKTNNPVIIANVYSEIEWVNDSFYKYFDFDERKTEKKKLKEIFSEEGIEERITDCAAQKKPLSYCAKTDTTLRKNVWFQTTLTPVLDHEDTIINFIIILSDITDIIELNSTRDMVISVITHDLKSPLFGFKMMTKALSENLGYYNPEQLRERINAMYYSSSSVSDLLENLTEWFKAQRGMLMHLPIKFDISLIINEIIKFYEAQAKLKSLEIMNLVKQRTEVFADENMIRIVLRNLLSNAIKFSESGKICFESEQDKDLVEISVSDEGIGIREHVKVSILDKSFNQGLGLFICKDFIEKNGGQLYFANSEIGTKVKFSLPNGIKP